MTTFTSREIHKRRASPPLRYLVPELPAQPAGSLVRIFVDHSRDEVSRRGIDRGTPFFQPFGGLSDPFT